MIKRFAIQLVRAVLLLVALLAGFLLAFSAITAIMLISGQLTPGQNMFGGDPAPTTLEALGECLIGVALIGVTMGTRRWLERFLPRG